MRLSEERTKRIDVPNDPDNGFVVIKALSMDKMDSIDEESTDIIVGEFESKMKLHPYKKSKDTSIACLISWGNLFKANKEELKFSKANKLAAADFVVEVKGEKLRFFEWVMNEHDKFFNEVQLGEEEAAKN